MAVLFFSGWENKCQDDSNLLRLQCYCIKMLGTLNRDGKGRDWQEGTVTILSHKSQKNLISVPQNVN